ncbi:MULTISPECIES: helix-turn-helix domain-containing protein [unclassified Variovorax]|uniref:helix-turn-helix domain-containing protein n=1 Tax=unclassified Variovorax TaxID=663243 RepID=UPI0013A55EF3|nr:MULTISPECIES: helix-turn-helix transcriptional regulator [unclassified Variovorax]
MKVDQKARMDEELRKRFRGIGEVLRSARMDRNMTQEDAAVASALSRQTVSRIERGHPSVAWGQVGRLAQVLGMPHLLGGEDPSAPHVHGRRARALATKDSNSST